MANSFQNSYANDKNPITDIRSITQYDENMFCTDTLQSEVLSMSAQLEKATSERDNLEKRLREIEDYLPSLVSWAVETTHAIDGLKESQKIKKSNKKSARG